MEGQLIACKKGLGTIIKTIDKNRGTILTSLADRVDIAEPQFKDPYLLISTILQEMFTLTET